VGNPLEKQMAIIVFKRTGSFLDERLLAPSEIFDAFDRNALKRKLDRLANPPAL